MKVHVRRSVDACQARFACAQRAACVRVDGVCERGMRYSSELDKVYVRTKDDELGYGARCECARGPACADAGHVISACVARCKSRRGAVKCM